MLIVAGKKIKHSGVDSHREEERGQQMKIRKVQVMIPLKDCRDLANVRQMPNVKRNQDGPERMKPIERYSSE